MKVFNTFIFVLIFVQSFADTDKYRLILRSDPATTATIAWNQISGSEAVVYYGTEDHGTDHAAYPRWAAVSRSTSYRGMENKFVRLSNLTPNTAYYFVIKDDEGSSQRFWFKTAPADKSRLSFIAGGDSRNNRTPRQNANKLVPKLKPHAVLFGGDMTNGDTSTEWQEWMDDWQLTIADDGRMFPIVAARGNHENASVIPQLFDSPNDDVYFALTFGDNLYRFYTLNTLISVGGNQKSWLSRDLKENSHAIWKSAQYHYPMRPHTSGKIENIFVYDAWAKVFYENKVRLVVECDSHMVKTTYPVKPSSGFLDNDGFERDNLSGTVYTGEGCWGAPLRDNDDNKSWTQSSGKFNQFKLIFVDENKIELRTIKVDNADQVAENSNDDVFTLPENLEVWKMGDPEQTEVVYIYKAIEADFAPTMPNIFDTTTVDINLEFTSPPDQVSQVTYSVVNPETGVSILLGSTTDVAQNYSSTIPQDGYYTLVAELTRLDGQIFKIQKNIYVGDFSTESTKSLFSGSNDISEEQDGDIVVDNSNLYLGYRFIKGFESIGLRFENVEIPQNATVDFAYILFTPNSTNNNLAEGLIQIDDSPDSKPFTDVNAELRDRLKAREEVIWQIPAWEDEVAGDATKTPNLKSLVQTIIDKRNWSSGNALGFSIKPHNMTQTQNNANRVAHAYESNPNKSPKLIYGYSFNSSEWASVVNVTPNVGINTTKPATPLDVNGLMRSSVRNTNGQLYICDDNIEGALGYDNKDKTIKVCTEKDGVYQWTIINL